MPTDHDSIVEALRKAQLVAMAKADENSAGRYLSAWEHLHVAVTITIPAVESLVAENARLRAALTKISDDDLRLDDEYAGSAYDRVVDAAYRALKGDD